MTETLEQNTERDIIQLPAPAEKGAVAVDWLSFTVPLSQLGWAKRFFGPVEVREWGLRNYKMSALLYCGGLMAWSPNEAKLRVYIELPSRALGHVREDLESVEALIILMHARGGRLTRIDLALDDVSGDLETERVFQAVVNDTVRTRWRGVQRHELFGRIRSTQRGEKAKTIVQGDTVYIGRPRESDIFARVYNKTSQVIHALGFRAEEIPENWCRLEVQISRKKAEEIGRRIVAGSFSPIEFIVRYIDFLEPRLTHKRHWTRSDWWSRIVGDAERDRLSWPKYRKGLAERIEHFRKSLTGTLKMLADIFGEEWVLDEIEKHGREKVANNSEHQMLIKRHRNGRGVAEEEDAMRERAREREAIRDETEYRAGLKDDSEAEDFDEFQRNSQNDY